MSAIKEDEDAYTASPHLKPPICSEPDEEALQSTRSRFARLASGDGYHGGFWRGIQTHYDIETAQRAIGDVIDAPRPRKAGRFESRAGP